jgi:hypothetical protein
MFRDAPRRADQPNAIDLPPSSMNAIPVIYEASSEQMKVAREPASSGVPTQPIGVWVAILSLIRLVRRDRRRLLLHR